MKYKIDRDSDNLEIHRNVLNQSQDTHHAITTLSACVSDR